MNWLILLYFLELGYSPSYESLNRFPVEREFVRNENIVGLEVTMDNPLFVRFHQSETDFTSNEDSDFSWKIPFPCRDHRRKLSLYPMSPEVVTALNIQGSLPCS